MTNYLIWSFRGTDLSQGVACSLVDFPFNITSDVLHSIDTAYIVLEVFLFLSGGVGHIAQQ